MRRAFLIMLTAWLGASPGWGRADAAAAWPDLPWPEGARAEIVAADSVLNGRRSRILRVHINAGLDEVLAFYRTRLGARRVENTLNGTHVIAVRQGDHFHTVQLQVLSPGRVQATLMSTRLSGPGGMSRALRDTQRLLPAGSTVINTMESLDDGRRAVTLTALNGAAAQTNRDALVRGLRLRGLTVTREERRARQPTPKAVSGTSSQPVAAPLSMSPALARRIPSTQARTWTLWADGDDEQVHATIVDAGEHRLVLVHRQRAVQP